MQARLPRLPRLPRIPHHKGVYILPNLFTSASLFAGFLGLLWASSGQYENCAMAIFVSAVMDGLDGKVARLTGTSSEFGIQYDSLADLVAFGVTPSFMVYLMALHNYSRLGIAVAFLFTVCSALRLARFNVSTSTAGKLFFTGLPTPAAGCALAMLVMVLQYMPGFIRDAFPSICLAMTALIAYLMVSRVRYAAFKEFGFVKAHPFRYMVFAILIFAALIAQPIFFGFLLLFGYIVSGIIYTFIIMPRKGLTGRGETPPPSAEEPGNEPGNG